MTPESKMKMFMAIMLSSLICMALAFVHLVVRPPHLVAQWMDIVLLTFMSLPFIGYIVNRGKGPSLRRRILAVLSPLMLGLCAVIGVFSGNPALGLGIGIALFVCISVYYYFSPRNDGKANRAGRE